jgi:8-oxo-dGTP pyrophosphatase MutT (NUDIX family)
MDLSILHDREGFPQRVIAALARGPVDFLEQSAFIEKHKKSEEPWDAGGILLLLSFLEKGNPDKDGFSQYGFVLNKRSTRVQQGGDLCSPGGGIHPFRDALFQKLLLWGLLPFGRGPGIEQAKKKGTEVYKQIVLFLGNALRESWEEIRLSPFNVEFLGALPAYRLRSRRWIMFPLVGRVKQAWKPKLSWEVEKIVTIPLEEFFLPKNYAIYSLAVPEKLIARGLPNLWEFPCFVHEEAGKEEILWGATFKVIQSFFKLVFDYTLPSPDGPRVIRRPLVANYFSGSEET